jgi:hypothetical protein
MDTKKLPKVANINVLPNTDANQKEIVSSDEENTQHNKNDTKKVAKTFSCKKCNYTSFNSYNYKKHLATDKHKDSKKLPKVANLFLCKCGKMYKYKSGLYKHKNTCTFNQSEPSVLEGETNKELISYLIKENTEIKQILIEQNKNMLEMSKNVGNNNNNTNNNNFNLQFFLNNTCKDALNIMDFVSQLSLTLNDLEETSRLGFVEGITKIVMNGLNKLDKINRPLHCSDVKREVMYIKDNDQWNKETKDKIILTNALKHVVSKNIKQITEWTKEHPNYTDSYSKDSDKYLKIINESMPDTNDEYGKIIKNIARGTKVPL